MNAVPTAKADTFSLTRGKVLHRTECPSVASGGVCSTAKAWVWAEGKTRLEVADIGMVFLKLRACRRCDPLGWFSEAASG